MLEIHNLKKSYRGEPILDIEWLRFEKNTGYALIGENGAGKTTLLRILAGTLNADAGEVSMEVDSKKVGYLPQNPYRFRLPILKSAMLGADKNTQAALDALALVGLDKDLKARGDKLSGGEAQRLALARIFAGKRELLLLDEPSSATDIIGTQKVEQALMQYCKANACAFIMASHSLSQVKRIAQRVIVLESGRVAECTTPEQLINDPQSEPAKRLVGQFKL